MSREKSVVGRYVLPVISGEAYLEPVQRGEASSPILSPQTSLLEGHASCSTSVSWAIELQSKQEFPYGRRASQACPACGKDHDMTRVEGIKNTRMRSMRGFS